MLKTQNSKGAFAIAKLAEFTANSAIFVVVVYLAIITISPSIF